MATTCIRNASWVVAWDDSAFEHRYLTDADVVFSGNTIDFVGKGFAGPVDSEIDGKNMVVLPGFVNTHAHPPNEPGYKGIREEQGVPEMYMTGLYERMLAMRLDDAGALAGTEIAYAELLKSGVTTIVDLSPPVEGWLDVAKRSGIRHLCRSVVRHGRLAARKQPRAQIQLGRESRPACLRSRHRDHRGSRGVRPVGSDAGDSLRRSDRHCFSRHV